MADTAIMHTHNIVTSINTTTQSVYVPKINTDDGVVSKKKTVTSYR